MTIYINYFLLQLKTSQNTLQAQEKWKKGIKLGIKNSLEGGRE